MSDQFSQLARHTVIVADTGDVEQIKRYKPTDATTNPSLLYAAVQDPAYDHLVDEAIQWAQTQPGPQLQNILDRLSVNIGAEISKLVPGLVSTELDSRLSFDTEASVAKARAIIASYKDKGVDKERILIKMASTWEGLKAAEVLEKEGIHVNMTLLFSLAQAVVAANVKATLVSPFVGRILDWSVANTDKKSYTAEEDPGVQSVTEIFNYFKAIGSSTVVMGASFRNKGEILALAGCDKLTIAPKLLEELKHSTDTVDAKLSADKVQKGSVKERLMTEKEFRWEMNENQMATEKLSDGIRKFAADTVKLEQIIQKKLKGQLNH
jgi:transaldolase